MRINTYILLFIFLCLCIGSIFLVSTSFVNAETAPKWYCTLFAGLAFVLAYVLFSFFVRDTRAEADKMFSCFCTVIAVVCTAQALYGIAQYTAILTTANGFRVTGSFDNPAGFAASLCAGFPFLFILLFGQKAWTKHLSIVAGLIIITGVVLSGSRAGVISLSAVALLVVFYKLRIKRSRRILIIATALILLLPSLYLMKKDSADGRLLIWQCSWEMIKDKSLFGYGHGGFKTNYMNYQAAYFEENPDSQFAMLADNVNRPFNEYILLLVNHGIFGLISLLTLCWFIWKSFLRGRHEHIVRIAAACLLSVAVFAFFSYPSRYPFVWVMIIFSISIIVYKARYSIKIPDAVIYPVFILIIPVVVFSGFTTCRRMANEMLWCKIANQSLIGRTEQMLPWYKQLRKSLFNNELFLYNYAAELNVAERNEESLQIALECEILWADYDLQMLMADNYMQLKKYDEAEKYY